PALSTCAPPDTRAFHRMSPAASSRRAAVAAPYARRRIRQRSRTGSDENGSSRNSRWKENMSDSEANSCTSGSVTCQQAEGENITKLMENICHAMDRLERRNSAQRRGDENAISV